MTKQLRMGEISPKMGYLGLIGLFYRVRGAQGGGVGSTEILFA
jgi:hypothetical protein